jgi:hypothetical protein
MINWIKKLFSKKDILLHRMSVNDYFDIEGIPQYKHQKHYEPKEQK